MAELNFVVDQNAVSVYQNTPITANFQEMAVALKEFTEPYEHIVYTEQEIPDAKKALAKLRSVKKHINDNKILVKRIAGEPLAKFEEECKSLMAICDKSIANIDNQVKESERIWLDNRKELLKEYFKALCKSMVSPEYVSFEATLHPKWENKGTTMNDCRAYMESATEKVDTEVKAIRNLHSEWETSLLNEYQKTHDLLSALGLHERLTQTAQQEAERRRKQQEEYERQQAELKRQQEEAQKLAANESKEEVPLPDISGDLFADLQAAIQADTGAVVEEEKEPVYIAHFRIYGTLDEITALRKYMNAHGIEHIYDGKEQTDLPIEALL